MTPMWWRIRTAPRDGTPFLAWCAEGADGEPHWAVCYFSISRTLCYDVGEIVDDDTFKPTHWLPLPQPPDNRRQPSDAKPNHAKPR